MSGAKVNVPSGSENNIPLTLACWKGTLFPSLYREYTIITEQTLTTELLDDCHTLYRQGGGAATNVIDLQSQTVCIVTIVTMETTLGKHSYHGNHSHHGNNTW